MNEDELEELFEILSEEEDYEEEDYDDYEDDYEEQNFVLVDEVQG